MNKYLLSSLILGSAFALASCSADEPGIAKGDGNVSLTVQLPSELATRFADAKQINTLYYSICTTGDDATVLDFADQPWPEGQTATTVDLQLVPGQTYQVVFFACNDEAEGYEYLPKTTQLNVSYKDVMTNNDQYDAFYAVESDITTTSTDKIITLTRPFAQLNIGTNDLGKGVVTEYLKTGSYSSTLTVPGLATGVNFLGKNYTTSTTNVVFTLNPVNTKIEDTYPVDNYNYLEMNYLLVAPPSGDAEGATLVNATYAINAGGEEVNNLNLSNLPLRANYQTNVYGSLLTTKSTFNVVLQKAFAGTAGVVDNGEKLNVVTTAEDLINNLSEGNSVYVAKNANIDFSTLPEGTKTDFNEPVTMVVEGTLSNIPSSLKFNDDVNISGGGTLDFDLSNVDHGVYIGHSGYPPAYQDVNIENVTITGSNAPTESSDKYPYIGALLEMRDVGEVNLKNVIVENYGGDAATIETDQPVTITDCKFISHNTSFKVANNTPIVGITPWGNTEFTFNNCEIVAPVAVWSTAANSPAGADSYTLVFNDCTLISNDPSTDTETGPFGIVALLGNGDATFNNCYLYSENTFLSMMWAFFKDRTLTYNNCFVNTGARNVRLSDDGKNLVPLEGNDYTYTAINPVITKTVEGETYTFGEKLNGSKVFAPTIK